MLINIFIFNILLYDGVVIVKDKKIVIVCLYLFLLELFLILKEFGICYRVVIGLLENLDVLIVIVFEEIGGIFVVLKGEFLYDFFKDSFEVILRI